MEDDCLKCFFDLHVHSTNSPDSSISITELFTRAKEEGLSGIAITDHDFFTYAKYKKSSVDNLLFIPGIEIRIKEYNCDLIALGTKEMPSIHKGLEETIDEIHNLGGIAIAPHPFDSREINNALGDRIFDVIDKLDGIEVTSPKKSVDNGRARKIGKEYGLGLVGGSDAHCCKDIGRGVTVCEDVYSVEELLDAIKSRKSEGLIRRFS
jgi:predicted metal-dependent phosphoesterase TrpH